MSDRERAARAACLIGLFDRLAGGVYTYTEVWGQEPAPGGSSRSWQQGPVRFLGKGLLWPWVKDPHQRFTALLDFEYEAPRADTEGAAPCSALDAEYSGALPARDSVSANAAAAVGDPRVRIEQARRIDGTSLEELKRVCLQGAQVRDGGPQHAHRRGCILPGASPRSRPEPLLHDR